MPKDVADVLDLANGYNLVTALAKSDAANARHFAARLHEWVNAHTPLEPNGVVIDEFTKETR